MSLQFPAWVLLRVSCCWPTWILVTLQWFTYYLTILNKVCKSLIKPFSLPKTFLGILNPKIPTLCIGIGIWFDCVFAPLWVGHCRQNEVTTKNCVYFCFLNLLLLLFFPSDWIPTHANMGSKDPVSASKNYCIIIGNCCNYCTANNCLWNIFSLKSHNHLVLSQTSRNTKFDQRTKNAKYFFLLGNRFWIYETA